MHYSIIYLSIHLISTEVHWYISHVLFFKSNISLALATGLCASHSTKGLLHSFILIFSFLGLHPWTFALSDACSFIYTSYFMFRLRINFLLVYFLSLSVCLHHFITSQHLCSDSLLSFLVILVCLLSSLIHDLYIVCFIFRFLHLLILPIIHMLSFLCFICLILCIT